MLVINITKKFVVESGPEFQFPDFPGVVGGEANFFIHITDILS